jgi:outer membrane protein assembly factor BamB
MQRTDCRLSAALVCTLIVWMPTVAVSDDAIASKAVAIQHTSGDWPQWRGPHGSGIAEANQLPPTKWSSTENVIWKANIPGRGHNSPIVVGDQVIVATADEEQEIQWVLSFDRKTGVERWRTVVHQGGIDRKGNKKTTQASATAACDGQRLFINFLNRGAIYTTALSLDGRQLWQTKVSDFATHQGFGSSPALHGALVYVTTDSRGGGVVAALDRVSGKIVWSHDRPAKANYASATLLTAAGREQLVVHGCDLVSSFDPASGKKLWEIDGATTECVTSLTTDGQRVFVSGGYPRQHVQAVEADGSGKTAWENTTQVYVPSMIVRDGVLYAVLDNGIATCWRTDSGEPLWKERLGGTFTASLVLVGENLFAVNEAGECFIYKASPEKFELAAKNKLGDEVYATPAICGSRIYMRVVEQTGSQRQEMLYCLGSR